MDLDGTGSPMGLVAKILKIETGLTLPIPIEDLAAALDIQQIAELETEGFEGGLLTDDCRSSGIILVNGNVVSGRRRFTIGHELGHFLIPVHKPVKEGQFLCSRDDMSTWAAKEQNAYARMEAEANQFAALMLMPPPMLRPIMGRFRDPDLDHVTQLKNTFDVSRDAASRTYAEFNNEPVAVVVVKDGKVARIYRHRDFPRMSVAYGQPVPRNSHFHVASKLSTGPTAVREVGPEQWLESTWGQRMPALYEQVLLQRDGYAQILLWAEAAADDEDEDPDEDRTSKQRYADQQARWRR